ncbi:tubulin binding cofactor C-domain-containing protein [Phellopilus nigrolimitatus]|nr:tubulin binding cofactor C-domain-containing protein [Phellopilus nigrolimitatus]
MESLSSAELAQEFYSRFQASRADITARLDTVPPTNDELVKLLAADIQRVRRELNDATPDLPTYDRGSCEKQLQELETRLEALRVKAAPKGKFAFRRKAAAPTTSTSTTFAARKPDQPEEPAPVSQTPNLALASTSYQYLTPASFSLPTYSSSSSESKAERRNTDFTLASLDHCVVNLLPVKQGEHDLDITAVHIHDVKDSLVLLGRVRGSVLAHNLERCTVVVACHQLRVHSSRSTRFYLHVASHAIIEDCANLAFTGYPIAFPLPPDVRAQPSTHHAVQDFSHLKSTPSPHWTVLLDPPNGGAEGNYTDGHLDGSENKQRDWTPVLASLRTLSGSDTDVDEERRIRLATLLAGTLPTSDEKSV